MPPLQYLILCDDKSLCIVHRESIKEDKNIEVTDGQRVRFLWPEDDSARQEEYSGEIIQTSTKETVLQIVKKRKIREIEAVMKANNHHQKKKERSEKQAPRTETAKEEPNAKKIKTTNIDTSAKSSNSLALKKKSNTDMAKAIFKVLDTTLKKPSREDDEAVDFEDKLKKDEPKSMKERTNKKNTILKELKTSLTKAQSLVNILLNEEDEDSDDEERTSTAITKTAPSQGLRSSSPLQTTRKPIDDCKSVYIDEDCNSTPTKPLTSIPVMSEDEDDITLPSTSGLQYRPFMTALRSLSASPERSEPKKKSADSSRSKHDFAVPSIDGQRMDEESGSSKRPSKSEDSDNDKNDARGPKSRPHSPVRSNSPVRSHSPVRPHSRERSHSPVANLFQSEHEDASWTLLHTKGVENKIVELMPGTEIFISKVSLSVINRNAKGQKQMARQLMEAIFTRNALRQCSLGGKKARGCGKSNDVHRPGLHQEAKTVLIEYVQSMAEKLKWIPVADQLIVQSMRAKLNEIKDAEKINTKTKR